MGTEDQREKAPSFLNFMLAVTDSFTKRQEEEREKQKQIISIQKITCYILRHNYKNRHKFANVLISLLAHLI